MNNIIFSIDIETSGPSLTNNGILAIGYCAGTIDGNILLKKRVCLSLENRCFDDLCLNEFWRKNEETLKQIISEQVTIKNALSIFINDLDEFDKTYNVSIISDCPTFDIGFINYYLSVYLDRLPLNYKLNNSSLFRPIYDTDCYSRGLLKMKYDSVWINDSDVRNHFNINLNYLKNNNHMPDNDAEYIYINHITLLKHIL